MKGKAEPSRPKLESNKTSRRDLKQSSGSAEALPDDSVLGGAEASDTQLRTCYHHAVFLTLYCDTCEEPVCDQCTIVGPHNTQMHKISNLMDAYHARVAKLSHIINGNLIKKRDELVSRINGIEARIEELKHRQEKIERDIRTECGYIMERLKNAEGSKQALLNHEMHVVQEELEHMQEIKRRFLELTKEEATVPQFLAASSALNKNIEFLLSKPVKRNPEVFPWDLPYELRDIREALDNNKVLVSASKFKQEAIWLLWEQKRKAEKEATAEMDTKANAEMKEWKRMTSKFSDELNKFQMVCYFCADLMDGRTVNEKCKINSSKNLNMSKFEGFTDEKPKNKFFGNQRHFFAVGKADLFGNKDIIAELKKMNEQFPKENPLLKSLIMHLTKNMTRIKKLCYNKGIDLRQIFESYDDKKTGKNPASPDDTINVIKFEYVLVETVGMDQKEVKRLIQLLDYLRTNNVNYRTILQWMDSHEDIPRFFDSILK